MNLISPVLGYGFDTSFRTWADKYRNIRLGRASYQGHSPRVQSLRGPFLALRGVSPDVQRRYQNRLEGETYEQVQAD